MKYLLTIVLLGYLAIACQKEIGFGNGSRATQTTSVRCTSCSYLPVCDSTKLTYVDSSAAGIDTIASTLAILGDTTINGRKFTRVSPSAIFSQGLLYNCDGGDYRIYQPVPNLGLDIDSLLQSVGLSTGAATIPSHIQTTILKSGANTGATWSDTIVRFSPFPLFDVVVKLDYKLEGKGLQRTLLGKVYSNVIHVSSKLNVVIPLMPLPFDVTLDYYFADGIGLIENRTSSAGAVQSLVRLYQYKIK
jgi:hypothetical protein